MSTRTYRKCTIKNNPPRTFHPLITLLIFTLNGKKTHCVREALRIMLWLHTCLSPTIGSRRCYSICRLFTNRKYRFPASLQGISADSDDMSGAWVGLLILIGVFFCNWPQEGTSCAHRVVTVLHSDRFGAVVDTNWSVTGLHYLQGGSQWAEIVELTSK